MSTPISQLWVCLQCGHFGCNRELNSHGVKHYEKTGHSLALQLESKAIWCYSCDEFIPLLKEESAHVPLHHAVHYISDDLEYREKIKMRKQNNVKQPKANHALSLSISTDKLRPLIKQVHESPGR